MHLLFFNLLPSCSFKLISNVLALLYYKGWVYPRDRGVRRPNQVLGTLCRQHFPGWATMPGEGQVPQLALSWELYSVTPAPPGEMDAAGAGEAGGDIVFHRVCVTCPLQK